jgi:hypothetical protein
MLAGYMKSKPLGPYFDFVWVHYADWVITTPMLLLDLGMLAGASPLPPPSPLPPLPSPPRTGTP